jgi:hypothetical protein
MMNLPAATTTISGQATAHSLNSEPATSAVAFSCSLVSTVDASGSRGASAAARGVSMEA